MSESPRPPGAGRRIVRITLLLVILAAIVYGIELAIPKHAYFLERKGSLVRIEAFDERHPRAKGQTVRLESSTGLRVDLRVLRPATEPGERLPALIVIGGERTGKDAVELVGVPSGVAYVALDYPYHGSQELDAFWESATAVPDVQQAFLDSPPALSLVVDWLQEQDWYDPNRVELVGASLGVPFAAAAGALDDRFTRVWLLHGGADNVPWVMHAGRRYIENEILRGFVARSALFLVYGNSFRTAAWIGDIPPRPLMVVAARDDDFVPAAARQPFVDAETRGELEIVWTEGLHIRPNRRDELQQLLDVVLSRIDGAEGDVH